MKDKEIRGEGTARVTKGKGGLWDTQGRKEKRAKRILDKDHQEKGKTREAERKEGRIQRNRGKWYSRVENYGKEKNRGKRRKEESEQFLKI